MIVHCAASVSFGMSLEEARAINVEGTRRMLELAGRYEQAQLRPEVAANTGYIDELIAPEETRSRLVWAYRTLEGGR